MTTKWKWIAGISGTIILGALGSGLWSVVFAPLGSTLIKGILSLVTLGVSSARDSVYASASRGYAEHPSVLLLGFFGAVVVMLPIAWIALMIVVWRRERELPNLSEAEFERRRLRARRVTRIILPVNALLGSIIFVQILLAGYTNTVISRFHQSLTIATPYISQEERNTFLARFAKVRTRQDFISVFTDLNATLVSHGETKSEFSPW